MSSKTDGPLTLIVDGATPEQLNVGLAAAWVVFLTSDVTPDQAAVGLYLADMHDARGYRPPAPRKQCGLWAETYLRAQRAAVEAAGGTPGSADTLNITVTAAGEELMATDPMHIAILEREKRRSAWLARANEKRARPP